MVSAIGSERSSAGRMSALYTQTSALLAGALAFFAVTGSASREARAEGSPGDKVAAEALFDEGKLLAKAGKYSEACPKFAESLRLDTGIGIMLFLADCY